jgi:class 3 adenylate cyclase
VPASGWKEKVVALLAIDLTFPPRPGVEAVDDEPWTLTSRWEETLVRKVQGFGGVLVQHVVSLFLVAFGLAQEVEQLPERAMQAALAIRQAVAAAQGQVGQAPVPEVRQSIHLGPLLVEEAGCEPPVRCLAVGETASIPIRLLGHTAPGEILVSPQVERRLAGWYTLQAHEMAVAVEHPSRRTRTRCWGWWPGARR